MNILSLDCEYNQPSGKTIQIGAAAYNTRNGQLVDKIEINVDPGEPISEEITKLTGIKDSDVSGCCNIREAYETLKLFHKKHKCFKNPLVWGSGTRNDSQHIYEEAYSEELRINNPNFMGYRVIDAKSIFQSIQLYNNDTVRGGLAKTCEKIGIGFEGDPHRALTDAVNTFRVWHFIVKDFPKRFK